jgi:hypothetical protein
MTRRWLPWLLAAVLLGWALLQVRLVPLEGDASVPLANNSEWLLCLPQASPAPQPGDLVLARGARGAFLGRVLSGAGALQIRGKEISVAGKVLSRQEYALQGGPLSKLQALVYTLGGRFFTLYAAGPLASPEVLLPADASGRFVLALNLSAGADLDSRRVGPLAPEQATAADCLLLWSPHRPWHLGTRVLRSSGR